MKKARFKIDLALDPPPFQNFEGQEENCNDSVHVVAESEDFNALLWFINFVKDRTAADIDNQKVIEESK